MSAECTDPECYVNTGEPYVVAVFAWPEDDGTTVKVYRMSDGTTRRVEVPPDLIEPTPNGGTVRLRGSDGWQDVGYTVETGEM